MKLQPNQHNSTHCKNSNWTECKYNQNKEYWKPSRS